MMHRDDDESIGPDVKLSSTFPEQDQPLTGKWKAILEACREHNITKLIELANSAGGFLEDEVRRTAWPLLLNCANNQAANIDSSTAWQSLPPHREERQVQLDVNRAFVYYPKDDSEDNIDQYKIQLFNLITRVLRTHPMLCYFQGYHEIVQVLLLVLGEHGAFPAAEAISLCRIRDYMLPNIRPCLEHLRLIPSILQLADPELANQVSKSQPDFAISSTLTLYAHEITDYPDIARLFDFLLANEPIMPLYLYTSIIQLKRSELMEIPDDEPEMIRHVLSKLPPQIDFDALITSTLKLYRDWPPNTLPTRVWKRISSYSVLRTTGSIESQPDVEEAEKLWYWQAKELAWEERKYELKKEGLHFIAKHKRPIASVGTAAVLGLLAIWLQRSGHDRTLTAGFWQIVSRTW